MYSIELVLVKKYVGLAERPDFGTPKVVSYFSVY
jgi:hypothetical protein